MQRSTLIMLLSTVMAIFSSAGLTATNELAYLVTLTTAIIGLIAGGLIADDERREAEAQKEFNNRLNK